MFTLSIRYWSNEKKEYFVEEKEIYSIFEAKFMAKKIGGCENVELVDVYDPFTGEVIMCVDHGQVRWGE